MPSSCNTTGDAISSRTGLPCHNNSRMLSLWRMRGCICCACCPVDMIDLVPGALLIEIRRDLEEFNLFHLHHPILSRNETRAKRTRMCKIHRPGRLIWHVPCMGGNNQAWSPWIPQLLTRIFGAFREFLISSIYCPERWHFQGNRKRQPGFYPFPDGFFHYAREIFHGKGHFSMVNIPVH